MTRRQENLGALILLLWIVICCAFISVQVYNGIRAQIHCSALTGNNRYIIADGATYCADINTLSLIPLE